MATRSEIRAADRLLTALGDPTRRAMIDSLCEGPATVSELALSAGISLTAIGQHLGVLERCGIVRTEKLGRVRTCRFEPKALTALQTWINAHRTRWEQNLDRLGAMLEEEDDNE